MKKYIISLLDPSHRWFTIFFFLFSVILITGSQLALQLIIAVDFKCHQRFAMPYVKHPLIDHRV